MRFYGVKREETGNREINFGDHNVFFKNTIWVFFLSQNLEKTELAAKNLLKKHLIEFVLV